MATRSWLRNLFASRTLRQTPPQRRQIVEMLEERIVLNNYMAATVADLIADIGLANAAGGANTISLTPSSTYKLTTVNNTANGATGLPVIAAGNNLTITGDSDMLARTGAAPAFRFFDVALGATLTLKNLTLQGGSGTEGGAIRIASGATASVVGSTIAHNAAATDGGAIFNQGTLDLNSSTITGSKTDQGRGGAIYNDGTLTLSNSTIADNQAYIGGGGIFDAGTLTVTASTIAYNSSTSSDAASLGGGGIFCVLPRIAALSSSIVAGNSDNNPHSNPDLGGAYYDSHGYNLIGAIGIYQSYAQNWNSTDQVGVRAFGGSLYLAPLGSYGGTTPIVALLPGSPAIGRGDPSLAGGADQRGVSRNQRYGVDSGAFQSRGFQLSVVGGNNQSAAITAPFAQPLVARVTNSFGDPVAGGVLYFSASAAANGASATTNPVIIDASSLATETAVANSLVGSYQVTASSIGVDPLVFNLTNTPASTSVSTATRYMVYGSANQSITLSATVSSAAVVNGGTVTFSVLNGGTPIGAALPPCPVSFGYASATFTLPGGTPTGSYNIVATYTPSANFIGSSNTSQLLQVTRAGTKTSTTSAFAPGSASDQTIPLSALVTATSGTGLVNSGTVTFEVFKGATQIGAAVSGPVKNGKASTDYLLPGGTAVDSYIVVATYNANSIYAGSSDSAHTLDVGLTGIFTNDIFAGASPNNQTLTLTAQVLTPSPAVVVNGGTVTFRIIGGGTIGNDAISGPVTNNFASATYILPGGTPTGTYTILATYRPNPDFVGSVDSTHHLTVGVTRVTMGLASQAVVIAPGDQTVPLVATVMPESGSGIVNEGTVTFRLLAQDGVTQFGTAVTSGAVTNGNASVSYVVPAGTPVGVYKILAVYNPSPLYFTSAKTAPFQLLASLPAVRAQPTINITPSSGRYSGSPITVSAVAVDADGVSPVLGSISVAYYAQNPPSGPPLSSAPINAGKYTVVATFTSNNPVFDNVSVPFPFTISPATPTVNVISPGGAYTGSPIPATATATGVDGKPLSGSYTFNYYPGPIPGGQPLPTAPVDVGTYIAIAFFSPTDPNYGGGAARNDLVVTSPPPAISNFAIPATGAEGSPITLSAAATNPYSQLDYTWTITRPDSSTFTLAGDQTSFVPPDNGIYGVSVTVTADNGTSSTRTGSIAVANVDPTITSFTLPAAGTKSYAVPLSATATDPAAANDPLTFTWTITRPDRSTATLTGASATYTPADSGTYTLSLTVSDGDGGSATKTSILSVYTRAASAKLVQGLYQQELGRTAGESEITFWVNVFDSTNGQAGAASGIINSTEARIRVIASCFQTYLGRTPSSAEYSFWAPLLGGQTEEQVLSQILGSTEFLGRAQGMGFGGTANQNFVRALYKTLLGRTASTAEVDAQVNAIQLAGMQSVVLSLLQSIEYRANIVRNYYSTLLVRIGSSAEVASWVNSNADLRAIRVGIESSQEFLNVNAQKAPAITSFIVPATSIAGRSVMLSAGANNPAGNFYPLTYTWTITRPNGTTLSTLAGTSPQFTPTDIGNFSIRLTVTDEDGFSVSGTASDVVSAPIPPTIVAAQYSATTPIPVPGLYYLTVSFSQYVQPTLSIPEFQIHNTTTNQDVTPTGLQYDSASNTAVITFNALADGNYTLTMLAAGITNAAGTMLDGNGDGTPGGNYTFNFFQLLGDINHDRKVDDADRQQVTSLLGTPAVGPQNGDADGDHIVGFADLVAVAQHYGQAGTTLAQGNFNGDGSTDFTDLVFVAQNYGRSGRADFNGDGVINQADLNLLNAAFGHTLPAPGSPVAAAPVVAAVTTTVTSITAVGAVSIQTAASRNPIGQTTKPVVSKPIAASHQKPVKLPTGRTIRRVSHAGHTFSAVPIKPVQNSTAYRTVIEDLLA